MTSTPTREELARFIVEGVYGSTGYTLTYTSEYGIADVVLPLLVERDTEIERLKNLVEMTTAHRDELMLACAERVGERDEARAEIERLTANSVHWHTIIDRCHDQIAALQDESVQWSRLSVGVGTKILKLQAEIERLKLQSKNLHQEATYWQKRYRGLDESFDNKEHQIGEARRIADALGPWLQWALDLLPGGCSLENQREAWDAFDAWVKASWKENPQ